MTNNNDLTQLVARTLSNVVAIIGDKTRFDVAGKELAPITQELSTLEALARRFAEGTLTAIVPEQEAPESDESDVSSDE